MLIDRKLPLIGGPLCGEMISSEKSRILVRLKAGAGPLIAVYNRIDGSYVHAFTKEAKEVIANSNSEYRGAELDKMDTPSKSKREYGITWTVWKLK